jgi:hypothetical protein
LFEGVEEGLGGGGFGEGEKVEGCHGHDGWCVYV